MMSYPRLPRIRSYNWRVMATHNKPTLYGLLAIALILVLIYAAEEYMMEHNLRLTRENEVLDLLKNHYALTTFGAPGYVKTDFTEGTERMDK